MTALDRRNESMLSVAVDQKIAERFAQLIQTGEDVARHVQTDSFSSTVDIQTSSQWGVSCLSLLNRVFSRESDHYKRFDEMVDKGLYHWQRMVTALGILKAAQDDYEHGYIFEARTLIEAEVFDDFLGQAEHLLRTGYYQPAAVVARSVLEDGLRKLCQRRNVTISEKPSVDKMNADLAKDGAYNTLMLKRVTHLADIRNKAAHGQWDQFTKADVADMVSGVRSFMEQHFT